MYLINGSLGEKNHLTQYKAFLIEKNFKFHLGARSKN